MFRNTYVGICLFATLDPIEMHCCVAGKNSRGDSSIFKEQQHNPQVQETILLKILVTVPRCFEIDTIRGHKMLMSIVLDSPQK